MLTSLALVLATLATSMLSGVFGMAGGMLLMGLMAWLLPVPEAMVLHGLAQLAANGWRAWLNRAHVIAGIVIGYGLGVLASLLLFAAVAFVPSQPLVLILLGLVPLSQLVLPERLALDARRPGQAQLCGFLVSSVQLVSGVAGPLLDVFFVRTPLTRHAVVATKAVAAGLGHLGKLGHFGVLLGVGAGSTPAWLPPAIVAAALAGTWLGKRLLDGLTDERFRAWSRALILGIGIVYLAHGLWLI